MGWKDAPAVKPRWQDAPPVEQAALPQPEPQQSLADQAKRQIGLTVRAGANAIAGLPLAAAEFGAGIGNLARGLSQGRGIGDVLMSPPEYSPTRDFNAVLDRAGVPEPSGAVEQGVQIVATGLAGSRIPVGQVTSGATAPTNFKPPSATSPKNMALEAAQREGYVVPPSTSNPTATNKTLEGIAGKLTTAQAASAKNQGVTNRLAARALGLPEDQPITRAAIEGVRNEAGKAYEAVRSAGKIVADDTFADDLAKIVAPSKNAAKDFPELVGDDVAKAVESVSKKEFDADSAVDAIRILRGKADEAYAAGKKDLGKAYKSASRSLESLIERTLAAKGKEGAAMLQAFRTARQLIAKSYTVESALNESAGTVNAAKLAQRLAKGKPIEGELRQIGSFAQAFPKAAREFNESLPGISPLDFYASGGVTAMTQQPWYLLYPFLRQGTRNALLSQAGQRLAMPATQGPVEPSRAMGAGNALLELARQQ